MRPRHPCYRYSLGVGAESQARERAKQNAELKKREDEAKSKQDEDEAKKKADREARDRAALEEAARMAAQLEKEASEKEKAAAQKLNEATIRTLPSHFHLAAPSN